MRGPQQPAVGSWGAETGVETCCVFLPSPNVPTVNRFKAISSSSVSSVSSVVNPDFSGPKNEKTARQIGGLFFQGRIVPTEAKPSELSGRNLMVVHRGCQANFLTQMPYKSIVYENCSLHLKCGSCWRTFSTAVKKNCSFSSLAGFWGFVP